MASCSRLPRGGQIQAKLVERSPVSESRGWEGRPKAGGASRCVFRFLKFLTRNLFHSCRWHANSWNLAYFGAFQVALQRRQWQATPVLLPRKSHGRRSLVGCSPWGRRVGHDWATSLSRIGKGNGNPLQWSCLENPRDGGAWWAAFYGVAQNRTRLKRLSSSRLPSVQISHLVVSNSLRPHGLPHPGFPIHQQP